MIPLLVSRREFVFGAGAATAAAWLGKALFADNLLLGDGPPLALGLQMYSLRGYPRDEAIAHAQALGVKQLEFYSGMLATDLSLTEVADFRSQLAEKGLHLSAHGVNRFTADRKQNRQVFEFARAAGIRNLTADPDPESFDHLDELVREFNIRIAIHNHGPRHRYNKVVDVLRAIEGRDERIGACADLGHYIRSGEQPAEVIRALRGRLYGVHLKDFAEMTDKTKGVILGQGHLRCDEVFAALVEVKFPRDGALSLEYEENPQNPLEDLRQCLDVARGALASLPA